MARQGRAVLTVGGPGRVVYPDRIFMNGVRAAPDALLFFSPRGEGASGAERVFS